MKTIINKLTNNQVFMDNVYRLNVAAILIVPTAIWAIYNYDKLAISLAMLH